MSSSASDEREAIIRAIADAEQAITRLAEEQAERDRELSDLRKRLTAMSEPARLRSLRALR